MFDHKKKPTLQASTVNNYIQFPKTKLSIALALTDMICSRFELSTCAYCDKGATPYIYLDTFRDAYETVSRLEEEE